MMQFKKATMVNAKEFRNILTRLPTEPGWKSFDRMSCGRSFPAASFVLSMLLSVCTEGNILEDPVPRLGVRRELANSGFSVRTMDRLFLTSFTQSSFFCWDLWRITRLIINATMNEILRMIAGVSPLSNVAEKTTHIDKSIVHSIQTIPSIQALKPVK